MAMKWMSRHARWIGCEVTKPAVPLNATSASIASTHNSDARVKSRKSFRALLADRVPGINPPAVYADLDF